MTIPSAAASGHLLIFARQPALGQVKTRLAADIGAENALAVYRELLTITAEAVAAADVAATVWLADAPEPPPTELPEWPGLPWQLQLTGDLGQRMARAFVAAFADGAPAVAIIGTDCPGLRPTHLEQAFTLLNSHDVVLGPATDGGYYLLGMKKLHAPLFANKEWSTDKVRAATLADAAQLGLSIALLPELADVDTIADLRVWRGE